MAGEWTSTQLLRPCRDLKLSPFIGIIRQASSMTIITYSRAVRREPRLLCYGARSATGFSRIIRTSTHLSAVWKTERETVC